MQAIPLPTYPEEVKEAEPTEAQAGAKPELSYQDFHSVGLVMLWQASSVCPGIPSEPGSPFMPQTISML